MKKITFILLALISIYFQTRAQNDAADFKKLLANFKEVNAGDKIDAVAVLRSINTNIDKQLAWNFLMEKNSFMKPEEVFAHPIAFYKRSENVVVVLFSTGEKGNAMFYNVSLQTYDLKKGKLIDDITMVASFNDKGNSFAEIDINADKKTIVFNSKSPLGDAPVKVEVSGSGKTKIIESKK